MPARTLLRAVLCAASLGLGLELFVAPRLDAQGDPPSALIPCGNLRGEREGGAAGGPPAGSAPLASTGMPPSLPTVPVVLANGMRVTPVQGNVYMLGDAGGNIAMQVGSEGVLLACRARMAAPGWSPGPPVRPGRPVESREPPSHTHERIVAACVLGPTVGVDDPANRRRGEQS